MAMVVVPLGCATSPTGRSQLLLYPEDEVAQLGAAAFTQLKQQNPPSRDPAARATVECVARRIVAVIPEEEQSRGGWELQVFDDETPNAFALPGGKIGVNTGMLKVAENESQLAEVIAHEVSHVIAQHTNERLSTSALAETGLSATQLLVGAGGGQSQQLLLAALGLGAQVGVLLPFSRTQEREADSLGLQLMAEAGFDPRESVELWRNMQRVGGGSPPEFLSTHPSDESRMADLAKQVPKVMPVYQQAVARGNIPACEYGAARQVGMLSD